MKIIVLAGGFGRRLWPISNSDYPKQFLSFFDKKSLLQKTLERLDDVDFVDHILISTNIKYKELLESKRPKSKKQLDILYEPVSKNTAPAIGLSVKYLENKFDLELDEPILVLPSDQLIKPVEVFFAALKDVLKSLSKIVTFGIKPTRPEVGYGYIKVKESNTSLKSIIKFIEKPPLSVAKRIFNNNQFFWNSGMFLFNRQILWESIEKCSEELFSFFNNDFESCLKNFHKLPSISFDHAVMEKTNKGFCLPLDIYWSDIGSWESLYDVLSKDKNQNVKVGNIVDLDTKNSLIISQKKMISTIGLENIICIETDDAIFLAQKGKSHDLKRLLDLIQLNSQKTH